MRSTTVAKRIPNWLRDKGKEAAAGQSCPLVGLAVGRRFFMQHIRARCWLRRADSEGTFAQRIKQAELLGQRARGQFAAQGALAFEDLLQVKTHGASLRNCFSNRRHAPTNPCRGTMAWSRAGSSAPPSMNCRRRALSFARPVCRSEEHT